MTMSARARPCRAWSRAGRCRSRSACLLALLRKKLAEFDAGGGDTRLVLSRDEIVELVRVFLPDSSNEARLIDQIETHINKVVDLGFLRRLKPAGGHRRALLLTRCAAFSRRLSMRNGWPNSTRDWRPTGSS